MDDTNEEDASTISDVSKKKEITWSDEFYLETVNLQESYHYISEGRTVMEEEPVPLQRKLGNEVLTSSFMDETNEDNASTRSEISKKKEITWSDDAYLEKVKLQNLGARSSSWMLERKASVGPCYRQSLPFGEPSGITVCLPKKPMRYASCVLGDCQTVKSGISINISKRACESKLRLFGPVQFETRRVTSTRRNSEDSRAKVKEDNYTHYSSNFKEKLDNFYGRIKHVFHI